MSPLAGFRTAGDGGRVLGWLHLHMSWTCCLMHKLAEPSPITHRSHAIPRSHITPRGQVVALSHCTLLQALLLPPTLKDGPDIAAWWAIVFLSDQKHISHL